MVRRTLGEGMEKVVTFMDNDLSLLLDGGFGGAPFAKGVPRKSMLGEIV